jgi:hypothetical protein
MFELVQPLAQVRDSVCAVLRIIKTQGKRRKKTPLASEFKLAFVGTAWCVMTDRFLVTAHHTLNNGKPRDSKDLFYAFTVPGNGPQAFHFPIVGFHLEDANVDVAILEIGPPTTPGQRIPSAPITFARPLDGTKVFTIGFPAPEIKGASLDQNGRFLGGGQFFLKGHVNEGIVAAQYDLAGCWFYEFNVGWHHGESGGPVFNVDPVAAFAVMQHYRTIQTPHGILPGPHRGRSLEAVQQQLIDIGAHVVEARPPNHSL